jgi:hypothetical protein
MTSLAEELLLLALDDESGKVATWTSLSLDDGLAGAIVCDLVLAKRIDLVDDRIVVLDDAPTGDPVLDGVLARIATRDKPRKPADWVSRLSRGIRDDVMAGLQRQGLVRAERRRVLGVLPTTRYPAGDPGVERGLRQRLHAVLVGGDEPDTRTGALIAIAQAAKHGQALVADRPWSEVADRAKEVAEGDWAADAVGRSIRSVNAGVIAAVVAGSTAGIAAS